MKFDDIKHHGATCTDLIFQAPYDTEANPLCIVDDCRRFTITAFGCDGAVYPMCNDHSQGFLNYVGQQREWPEKGKQ